MISSQIKIILTHISVKYNISYKSLELDINKILTNLLTEFNESKCHAYIMVNGNKVQCSRSKKDCNFCVTHYKQDKNNVLKYGKIDQDKIKKDKIKKDKEGIIKKFKKLFN